MADLKVKDASVRFHWQVGYLKPVNNSFSFVYIQMFDLWVNRNEN